MRYRYYPNTAAPDEWGRHGDDGNAAMGDPYAAYDLGPGLMEGMIQYPLQDLEIPLTNVGSGDAMISTTYSVGSVHYGSAMGQGHLQYEGPIYMENDLHERNLEAMYPPSSSYLRGMTAVVPAETYPAVPQGDLCTFAYSTAYTNTKDVAGWVVRYTLAEVYMFLFVH